MPKAFINKLFLRADNTDVSPFHKEVGTNVVNEINAYDFNQSFQQNINSLNCELVTAELSRLSSDGAAIINEAVRETLVLLFKTGTANALLDRFQQNPNYTPNCAKVNTTLIPKKDQKHLELVISAVQSTDTLTEEFKKICVKNMYSLLKFHSRIINQDSENKQ